MHLTAVFLEDDVSSLSTRLNAYGSRCECQMILRKAQNPRGRTNLKLNQHSFFIALLRSQQICPIPSIRAIFRLINTSGHAISVQSGAVSFPFAV